MSNTLQNNDKLGEVLIQVRATLTFVDIYLILAELAILKIQSDFR